MDPLELLELCKRGAYEGAPQDIVVPRLFSAGEYEDLWRRESKQVRALLDELLCGPRPDEGLELLLKSGCLEALFPEIREMRGLGEDPVSALHKDVWSHTKQVVANTPADLELRWGALMHDIGKARTRRVIARKVTFHSHDIVGARMVDALDARLGLFRDDTRLSVTVRMLVLNHLRPAQYKKEWADSGVRRLLVDVGGMKNFDKLMALSRADLTTKNPNKRARAQRNGDALEAHVRVVFDADSAPKLPKGTMGLIIEKGLCPVGPRLNVIRGWLEQMMKDGRLPTDKDAEFYATTGFENYLQEHAKKTDEIHSQMQAHLDNHCDKKR
jgi:poly(A) polymerase